MFNSSFDKLNRHKHVIGKKIFASLSFSLEKLVTNTIVRLISSHTMSKLTTIRLVSSLWGIVQKQRFGKIEKKNIWRGSALIKLQTCSCWPAACKFASNSCTQLLRRCYLAQIIKSFSVEQLVAALWTLRSVLKTVI